VSFFADSLAERRLAEHEYGHVGAEFERPVSAARRVRQIEAATGEFKASRAVAASELPAAEPAAER